MILAGTGDPDLLQCHLVESGVLPGLMQSAIRAEVFAVIRAITFAVDNDVSVMIWTDCAAGRGSSKTEAFAPWS